MRRVRQIASFPLALLLPLLLVHIGTQTNHQGVSAAFKVRAALVNIEPSPQIEAALHLERMRLIAEAQATADAQVKADAEAAAAVEAQKAKDAEEAAAAQAAADKAQAAVDAQAATDAANAKAAARKLAAAQATPPQPVAATPKPVATPVAAPAASQGSGACGGNLPPCYVMNRESRGSLTVYNTEGSGASGKWQFMPGTWNGYGGYANAADAPESVQDARAAQVWAGGAGCSNWAAC
jgi:membrane protein involved in colicin uptake